MQPAEPSATRVGAVLLALGAAPFLAATALRGTGAPMACPFSIVAGAPCPLCGSTRSFSLAAQGDPAFLQFNPVWVGVAVAVGVAGAALLVLAATGRRRLPRAPAGWLLPAVPLLVAAAWTWALVQRDAIGG